MMLTKITTPITTTTHMASVPVIWNVLHFILYNNPLTWGFLLLVSFYKWGTWGSGRLNNLPEVTEIVSGEAGIQAQAVRLLRPCSDL